jgi:hypothetical protein
MQPAAIENSMAASSTLLAAALRILGSVNDLHRSNDLARSWLGGVNLRLRGLALGRGGCLLADERLLFHSHFGFLRFYLTALRSTLVQADGQSFRHRSGIFKLLQTKEGVRIIHLAEEVQLCRPAGDGLNFNPYGLNY